MCFILGRCAGTLYNNHIAPYIVCFILGRCAGTLYNNHIAPYIVCFILGRCASTLYNNHTAPYLLDWPWENNFNHVLNDYFLYTKTSENYHRFYIDLYTVNDFNEFTRIIFNPIQFIKLYQSFLQKYKIHHILKSKIQLGVCSAYTIPSNNVGIKLSHRLRRCNNFKPTLYVSARAHGVVHTSKQYSVKKRRPVAATCWAMTCCGSVRRSLLSRVWSLTYLLADDPSLLSGQPSLTSQPRHAQLKRIARTRPRNGPCLSGLYPQCGKLGLDVDHVICSCD